MSGRDSEDKLKHQVAPNYGLLFEVGHMKGNLHSRLVIFDLQEKKEKKKPFVQEISTTFKLNKILCDYT